MKICGEQLILKCIFTRKLKKLNIKKASVCKVENILKGSLDTIPSPGVKIQFMDGKVCLRCKGKTLLDIVNTEGDGIASRLSS